MSDNEISFEEAAARLYPNQGKDNPGSSNEPDQEPSQAPERPPEIERTEQQKADTLYGKDAEEASLYERYYKSVKEDIDEAIYASRELGVDFQQTYIEMANRAHELGMTSGELSEALTASNRLTNNPLSEDEWDRIELEFVRDMNARSDHDRSMFTYGKQLLGHFWGQEWLEKLEHSGFLFEKRDMVIDIADRFRRNYEERYGK